MFLKNCGFERVMLTVSQTTLLHQVQVILLSIIELPFRHGDSGNKINTYLVSQKIIITNNQQDSRCLYQMYFLRVPFSLFFLIFKLEIISIFNARWLYSRISIQNRLLDAQKQKFEILPQIKLPFNYIFHQFTKLERSATKKK